MTNAYMREYKKRAEAKKRNNERIRKRYKNDPEFRKKRIATNKRWQSKHQKLGLGDPENIKSICKEFGFSDEVSEAIALDGEVLDRKMRGEDGKWKKKQLTTTQKM